MVIMVRLLTKIKGAFFFFVMAIVITSYLDYFTKAYQFKAISYVFWGAGFNFGIEKSDWIMKTRLICIFLGK